METGSSVAAQAMQAEQPPIESCKVQQTFRFWTVTCVPRTFFSEFESNAWFLIVTWGGMNLQVQLVGGESGLI